MSDLQERRERARPRAASTSKQRTTVGAVIVGVSVLGLLVLIALAIVYLDDVAPRNTTQVPLHPAPPAPPPPVATPALLDLSKYIRTHNHPQTSALSGPPPGNVDCMVSSWSAWSPCQPPVPNADPATEYVNVRTRYVTLTPEGSGSPCPPLKETRPCVPNLDCQVSTWSAWSPLCPVLTCGANQTRSRSVETEPSGQGAACPPLSDSRECVVPQCLFSEWTNQEPVPECTPEDCTLPVNQTRTLITGCDATCGSLIQTDVLSCNCALNCTQSEWSLYTPCNPQAHNCTSVYTRLGVTARNPVTGAATTCGTLTRSATCDADCVFAEWTPWSVCYPNTGYVSRSRNVQSDSCGTGAPCSPLAEIQNCTVDCVVSVWSAWSVCDPGTSTQNRTRTVTTEPLNGGQDCPPLVESQGCVPACTPAYATCEALVAGCAPFAPNACKLTVTTHNGTCGNTSCIISTGCSSGFECTDVSPFSAACENNTDPFYNVVVSATCQPTPPPACVPSANATCDTFADCLATSDLAAPIGINCVIDDIVTESTFNLTCGPGIGVNLCGQTLVCPLCNISNHSYCAPFLAPGGKCTFTLDCIVGPWSAWSACNVDTGNETRTRNVTADALPGGSCVAPLTENRPCGQACVKSPNANCNGFGDCALISIGSVNNCDTRGYVLVDETFFNLTCGSTASPPRPGASLCGEVLNCTAACPPGIPCGPPSYQIGNQPTAGTCVGCTSNCELALTCNYTKPLPQPNMCTPGPVFIGTQADADYNCVGPGAVTLCTSPFKCNLPCDPIGTVCNTTGYTNIISAPYGICTVPQIGACIQDSNCTQFDGSCSFGQCEPIGGTCSRVCNCTTADYPLCCTDAECAPGPAGSTCNVDTHTCEAPACDVAAACTAYTACLSTPQHCPCTIGCDPSGNIQITGDNLAICNCGDAIPACAIGSTCQFGCSGGTTCGLYMPPNNVCYACTSTPVSSYECVPGADCPPTCHDAAAAYMAPILSSFGLPSDVTPCTTVPGTNVPTTVLCGSGAGNVVCTLPCPTGLTCLVVDTVTAMGICACDPNNDLCSDHLLCNGNEYCDGNLGACRSTASIDCPAGSVCRDILNGVPTCPSGKPQLTCPRYLACLMANYSGTNCSNAPVTPIPEENYNFQIACGDDTELCVPLDCTDVFTCSVPGEVCDTAQGSAGPPYGICQVPPPGCPPRSCQALILDQLILDGYIVTPDTIGCVDPGIPYSCIPDGQCPTPAPPGCTQCAGNCPSGYVCQMVDDVYSIGTCIVDNKNTNGCACSSLGQTYCPSFFDQNTNSVKCVGPWSCISNADCTVGDFGAFCGATSGVASCALDSDYCICSPQ